MQAPLLLAFLEIQPVRHAFLSNPEARSPRSLILLPLSRAKDDTRAHRAVSLGLLFPPFFAFQPWGYTNKTTRKSQIPYEAGHGPHWSCLIFFTVQTILYYFYI